MQIRLEELMCDQLQTIQGAGRRPCGSWSRQLGARAVLSDAAVSPGEGS